MTVRAARGVLSRLQHLPARAPADRRGIASEAMRRYCFVHAADLHLDTPFEGIRNASLPVNEALRDASLDAFDALVDLTLSRDAAFLLLAGDLYDGAERGIRAQLRFRSGIERLAHAGVPVFVVHGNHDPTEEGWAAIREWPPLATVFESTAASEPVAGVPVVRDGARLATVYGISYARREVSENLSLRFPRGGQARPAECGLRIGLLHCNASSSTEHAAYSPCTVADLAEADVDYWALGHVHRHRILARGEGDDPWIVYPGNLQGRSPHPGEQGAKGAVVVEVEGGAVANVEFCALDRVRFLDVPLDISELEDLASLQRTLVEAARETRSAHAGRGLVLTARLEGRGALHRDLARANAGSELLASLRDETRDLEPFLWWAAVVSNVRAELDRDALLERDDFCAALVTLSESLAERPEDLARTAEALFEELPDELRGVAIPEPGAGELLSLLAHAEEAALELVEGFGAGATSEPEGRA